MPHKGCAQLSSPGNGPCIFAACAQGKDDIVALTGQADKSLLVEWLSDQYLTLLRTYMSRWRVFMAGFISQLIC